VVAGGQSIVDRSLVRAYCASFVSFHFHRQLAMRKQRSEKLINQKTMKKIALWLSGAGTAIAGLALTVAAHAQTIPAGALSVPSSTVTDLLASVSNIFTDPGIRALVVIAAAIPLVVYFAKHATGLLPKSRARA